MIQYLLKTEIDINAVNIYDKTALEVCVKDSFAAKLLKIAQK